jgi:hypothetical protein
MGRAGIVMMVSVGWLMAIACRSADGPAVDPKALAADTSVTGCVAQTGQPDVFLLSVAVPRDAQFGSPAGTVVPQPSRSPDVPQSAGPAPTGGNRGGITSETPPAGASSGPGAGPTSTTKIDTYRLVGSGGLNLQAHVGHTIEVKGSRRTLSGSSVLAGELHVESARAIAAECLR